MKIQNIAFALLIITFLNSCNQKSNTDFYLPAEWEPHKAMIVSFDNDLAGDSVSVEMVRSLHTTMKVYCIVLGDSLIPYYQNWFNKEGIRKDSIQFIASGSSFSYACRDPLFFLKNDNNEYKLMDFAWNDYGYKPDAAKKESYFATAKKDRHGFETSFLKTFPFPIVKSKMIHEGGAIEVNGEGVLLQVESVNMQRNPSLTKEEQEEELKRTLGIKKVIWLKEGPADDPDGRVQIAGNFFGIGVNGHVDEFCRFASSNTIFLAYPDEPDTINNPIAKITLERMRVNYDLLLHATDQNGKSFKIVKFPIPELNYKTYALDSTSQNEDIKYFSRRVLKKYSSFHMHDTCYSVPASSYLNYLVTNKKVLIPMYWKPGDPEAERIKDDLVKKIFKGYFPGREIIQINPEGLNYLGGGLHCWSQQIPK